jgi:predicted negative regulator of RcsB-dependent stress response
MARDYHSHLLIMLGRCYYEAGSFKEALNLLEKSLESTIQGETSSNLSIVPTLQLMAKVHLKLKDPDQALALLN